MPTFTVPRCLFTALVAVGLIGLLIESHPGMKGNEGRVTPEVA
jgi:hypothetical protein